MGKSDKFDLYFPLETERTLRSDLSFPTIQIFERTVYIGSLAGTISPKILEFPVFHIDTGIGTWGNRLNEVFPLPTFFFFSFVP